MYFVTFKNANICSDSLGSLTENSENVMAVKAARTHVYLENTLCHVG